MISDAILQLCAVSVICGLILTICPNGSCKSVMQILCTAMLICAIVEPIINIDFESYIEQSVKVGEIEDAFLLEIENVRENLSQTVMQEECCEYILDKAMELGLEQIEVKVTAEKDGKGVCLPYASEVIGRWCPEQKIQLEQMLENELGIPKERQTWTHV